MSLKAFHIFFIIVSILLAAGCAAWGFVNGLAPADLELGSPMHAAQAEAVAGICASAAASARAKKRDQAERVIG